MVNKSTGKANKSYDSSSVPALVLIGGGLILVGVLIGLSVVMGEDGALFGAVKQFFTGITGCLSLGFAALLIWCGVLVWLSASRKVSFRALLITCGIFLIALSVLNLLSRIGNQGFFVDYCTKLSLNNHGTDSFGDVFKCAYVFCSRAGEPGGALGMLLAWPLHKSIGIAFGAIILIALLLVMVLWLLRFDVNQRLDDAKVFISNWKAKQAERRARQEQQQNLWDPAQESGNKRSVAFHKQQAAAKAMFDRRINAQEAPAQEAEPVAASVHAGLCPAPSPDLELYDEVIVVNTPSPAQERSETKAGGIPRTTITTPENEEVQKQRKTIDRFEEMRKRKVELTSRFGGAKASQQSVADQEAQETVQDVYEPVKADAVMEEEAPTGDNLPMTVPQAEEPLYDEEIQYHPLVDEGGDDEPYEELQPHMPESTTMHTPHYAPLVGVELQAPAAEEETFELLIDDEEEEPEPVMPYHCPPVELLNREQYMVQDTHEADQENAQKLVKTLSSFGIPAKVQHITHGPAITRFALGLTASGINVKRIQNIADNIALELAADGPIRIESQIIGTNLFGIEVPNKEVQTVTFAQVLLSNEMQAATSPLAVGLGHDITGKPVICDLAKMPHLLIAGTTGSGKSVCVNTIINSLLFRVTPEDVRMIMIDPKVVELQCYNVIPHLLIPVVSDAQKAAGALAWAVAEMEDRYKKMLTKNVRELNAYNAKLEPGEPKLPRIVIIIDELADLMMASKHDVEESIIRLAQKARAAGIHMVIATQRPTVDVITGLIKSNVPSRIAFAVSSLIDSRTILDKGGAEKLLGRGDMLYMPTGVKSPVRVQGCFLSDNEIENIVDYIAANSRVDFDPNVIEALERQNEDTSDVLDDGGSDGGVDDRLMEALEMVVMDRQASISMLQRRMKIGYARAGRLIDDMAQRGFVSQSLGSKPREVLISREEFERIKETNFFDD